MGALARATLSFALGAAIGALLAQSLLPQVPAARPSYGAATLAPSAQRDAARDARARTTDYVEPLPHEAVLLESERDLRAALQLATGLDEPARRLALRRLGDHWGSIDALHALAAAQDVENPTLRRTFRGYVLEAWAGVDPGAVLEYLPAYLAEESANQSGLRLDTALIFIMPNVVASRDGMLAVPIGVWTALAAADAYALLSGAERFTDTARGLAQQFAIVEVARRDVGEALAFVERLQPASRAGNQRENLLDAVAHVYARSNLDAAWAWVRALDPRSEAALIAVMFEAAATNAESAARWAIEVALDESETAASPSRRNGVATTAVEIVLAMSPEHSAYFADQFATARNARARVLLQTVLSAWSRHRPNDAFEWLLANRAQLGAEAAFEAFHAFDDALVSRDPDLALRVLSELPRDRRSAWIAPRVIAATRADLRRAERFVDRLAGGAEHDAAVAAFIESLAREDPVAAARRVDLASSAVQARASAAVAAAWARSDPPSAAEWTLRIAHPLERASAVYSVAAAWGEVDPDSARDWLLAMPEGVARDSGLDVLRTVIERAEVSRALAERVNADDFVPALNGAGE